MDSLGGPGYEVGEVPDFSVGSSFSFQDSRKWECRVGFYHFTNIKKILHGGEKIWVLCLNDVKSISLSYRVMLHVRHMYCWFSSLDMSVYLFILYHVRTSRHRSLFSAIWLGGDGFEKKKRNTKPTEPTFRFGRRSGHRNQRLRYANDIFRIIERWRS